MLPDANNLYGLTPGETYTLSGSVSHTAGELKFRSQYSTDGSSWIDLSAPSDLGIPVSDGSAFTSFSHTFTVPDKATGIYISLQNYDYTAGSLFRFKNMKLEKGSVATNWCLSQSELTTTTGSYRGVTLNDRGLTATAGGTTVAMNSNAGFLINNLKHDSADNPGGQVFHVDTDGNLTMQGNITAGTIAGVTLQGENLTLTGSLKLNADSSAISSSGGDVVFNKNGIIATSTSTSGTTTVAIDGTNSPLRIQYNNNDIFKVDNDGNLTISGNLAAGDSPNSTISGVNFTGDNLTLTGSMKVNGQILFANSNGVFNGVLSSQGLSLKGGGLSISDDKGNQTTYVISDGTFITKKGFFSGTIKGSNIILKNDDGSVINANGGTFMVDGAGNVTAKSIKITGNQNDNANNSASLNGVSIYNGSVIKGSRIIGNTITGNTIIGGKIIGSDMIGGRFSSQSNGANGISAVEYNHEYTNNDPNVSPNFYVTNSGALQLTKVIKSDILNTPGSFYTPYHIDGDVNIAITKGEQDYKYYRLGVYAAQNTSLNDGLDIIYNLANNALNSNALSNNYLRGMNRYCFTLSEIPTGKDNIGITDSFSNPKIISLSSDDFNSGLLNITYNGTTKSVNTNQEWYHLFGDLGDRQYVSIPMSFTARKFYELGIIVNANQEESNISLILESVGTKRSTGSYSSFSNVNIAPSGSLILSHGLYSNGYSEASGEANEAILNSELYRTELNSNSVHVSSITRGSNMADGASYYNYVDISSRGIYIGPTQHPDSQDSPARLTFAGDNSDNTGIFFDGYGNLHGRKNSACWEIKDDKNNSVAIFPLNEQNNLIQFYTGLKVFPSGADHGIRTAWVSWSGWDGGERYPAIVQDGPNWGGICFPKSGHVTLFDDDAHYYTPDKNIGIGGYDGYGG